MREIYNMGKEMTSGKGNTVTLYRAAERPTAQKSFIDIYSDITIIKYASDNGPPLKPVIWIGRSLKDLREFPSLVQDYMGYALYVAQRGGKLHAGTSN